MKDMGKATVIKLPNGTVIELSSDMSPEQITALVNAVSVTTVSSTENINETSQAEIQHDNRSTEEIWESSKKERVALFLRNYISDSLWFTAKQVQELQLTETGTLALGETSAIATYLMRLHESGLLDRNKSTKGVQYKITSNLIATYPQIEHEQFNQLLQLH